VLGPLIGKAVIEFRIACDLLKWIREQPIPQWEKAVCNKRQLRWNPTGRIVQIARIVQNTIYGHSHQYLGEVYTSILCLVFGTHVTVVAIGFA